MFKVDPRPIPMPRGANIVANGVSVFVQGTGAYAVYAIGAVAGLVMRLGTL